MTKGIKMNESMTGLSDAEGLTDEEVRTLCVAGRGMCPFSEDIRDASMCECGLPALDHDEAVARLARKYEHEFLATVEAILAAREQALIERIAQAIEAAPDWGWDWHGGLMHAAEIVRTFKEGDDR